MLVSWQSYKQVLVNPRIDLTLILYREIWAESLNLLYRREGRDYRISRV
jgi:hypothetical protein